VLRDNVVMRPTFLHSFVLLTFCGALLLPEKLVEYQSCCLAGSSKLAAGCHTKNAEPTAATPECCKPKVTDLKQGAFAAVSVEKDVSLSLVAMLAEPVKVSFQTSETSDLLRYQYTDPSLYSNVLSKHCRCNE
jgi:hypothetical protein